MLSIKEIKVIGYEKVIEAIDPENHLHAFIAIHNSKLGPALGGTRIYPYKSREEALNDVLRLAKGMTYKSAIAENKLGGGKSVIIADPKKEKTEGLLLSFANLIDQLHGQYIAAEDVGSSTDDMAIIRRITPYVAALQTEKSSGDPSKFTAWGVYRGIQAVSEMLWQTSSLEKRTAAIQGLGSAGSKLANLLFWAGMDLIACDVEEAKTDIAKCMYRAKIVKPEDIYEQECDIFVPCAMGGILNETSIAKLRCKAVAGSANNQLLTAEDGQRLADRGILYAPDYIINAGGIINASFEFSSEGYNPKKARDKVHGHIFNTLIKIFQQSKTENRLPGEIADELAELKLKANLS